MIRGDTIPGMSMPRSLSSVRHGNAEPLVTEAWSTWDQSTRRNGSDDWGSAGKEIIVQLHSPRMVEAGSAAERARHSGFIAGRREKTPRWEGGDRKRARAESQIAQRDNPGIVDAAIIRFAPSGQPADEHRALFQPSRAGRHCTVSAKRASSVSMPIHIIIVEGAKSIGAPGDGQSLTTTSY